MSNDSDVFTVLKEVYEKESELAKENLRYFQTITTINRLIRDVKRREFLLFLLPLTTEPKRRNDLSSIIGSRINDITKLQQDLKAIEDSTYEKTLALAKLHNTLNREVSLQTNLEESTCEEALTEIINSSLHPYANKTVSV